MCGRIIQASGPLRLAIVDGLGVVDSRYGNVKPRYNGAPGQEMLVIRRNPNTSERSLDPLKWGLIPYWCEDPKGGRKPINAKSETISRVAMFRDAYARRPITSSRLDLVTGSGRCLSRNVAATCLACSRFARACSK